MPHNQGVKKKKINGTQRTSADTVKQPSTKAAIGMMVAAHKELMLL